MAENTDRSLGIALVCGVIAAIGGLYTFVAGAGGVAASNGFALAIVFGALAVASMQAFE